MVKKLIDGANVEVLSKAENEWLENSENPVQSKIIDERFKEVESNIEAVEESIIEIDGANLHSFADVEAALEEVGVKPEEKQAIIDTAIADASTKNTEIAKAINDIAAILNGAPEDLNTFAEGAA